MAAFFILRLLILPRTPISLRLHQNTTAPTGNIEAMAQALQNLRVLELGNGPTTGMAGMILADFGAEVLQVCAPRTHALQQLPAAPMWSRGKQRITLDLNKQRDALDGLCAAADVLLCNFRPSTMKRFRLDADEVQARHPHLIHAQISGFGRQGPLADLPGYEHVVAAYAGRMLQFSGLAERAGPVWSAVQVGVHATVQSVVAGICAALYQRNDSGRARSVHTSLLQGMLPYEMGAMIGLQFPEQFKHMLPAMQVTPTPPPPSLYYHPAQAGDGRWMQFGNLLPHLFDNFLIATDLIDVLADPAFDPKQMMLRPAEKQEAFRERMLSRIQEQPAEAWMARFVEDGSIVATTYQTTQQALQDPDVTANGHAIPLGDDGVQLGPLVRLSATPATPGATVVQGDGVAERWRAEPRPEPDSGTNSSPSTALPLSGVRVVEIATIIAAPLGCSFLADMGADVIKVEQLGGDPFRSMLAGLGSARVNAGKRSISVNLKSDQGREVVLKLLADADIVVHNYRPGVPERLGIGYEAVRALNPQIIYLQSNGYGPEGPGAHRPSTHPIPGAAMGGVVQQMGGELPAALMGFAALRDYTSRLMRANELNPDPNTALVVASAASLALEARRRTGLGQQIIMDMFGANAYANADDFLNYPGKAPRAKPDVALHGLNPLYRLYRCANEQWVYVALTRERDQQSLVRLIADAGMDGPDQACLAAADENTATALGTLFAQRDADYWESLCTPEGLACVRADRAAPADFWVRDIQSAANHFVGPAQHPVLGNYTRTGTLVEFDGGPASLQGPPLAGQHNAELLLSLGYTREDVEDMLAQGVLWREAPDS